MAPRQVGETIDAFCAKCSDVGPHLVVSLKGTRAGRTECQTCNSVHAYRKNPPGAKRSTAGAAKNAALRRYDTAMEGRDQSKAIKYTLSHKFKEDDVVNHKVFGIGVVSRTLSGGKIEVIFPEATKLLVHSR